MPKIYATVPGAEVWIPPYGMATNDSPAVVPAAVGAELAKVDGLRVEPDEEVITIPPGIYATRQAFDTAVETATVIARANRPKSEKE